MSVKGKRYRVIKKDGDGGRKDYAPFAVGDIVTALETHPFALCEGYSSARGKVLEYYVRDYRLEEI